MSHRQHAIDLDDDAPHIQYFESGAGIPSRTVLCRRDALPEAPFDENLPVREDPELWTRLLADVEAERIPEALATKRRRPDSITGDPERNFRAELQEIEQLCQRFPELETHRAAREMEAHFRYGRQLLKAGDPLAADVLEAALRQYPDLRDYRVWATYLCARLPAGLSNLAYGALERVQEVLK